MWIRGGFWAAFLACASVAAAQGHTADVVTPFERSSRGGIVVDVLLDGRGPFRLLLDTGSTHTVITEQVADAIGAKAVATSMLTSSAGARMVPIVAVDRLTIGHVTLPVLPSVVPRLPVEGEADGLLGQDVLGARRYTIDYRRTTVIWHDDCSHALDLTGEVIPLEEDQGRFVVSATADADPVRLVVDTGTETLVLFGLPPWPDVVETTVRTISGARRAAVGRIRTLRLGTVEQSGVVAVHMAVDIAPGQAEGLLP
jgi:predicted aspartyl protease